MMVHSCRKSTFHIWVSIVRRYELDVCMSEEQQHLSLYRHSRVRLPSYFSHHFQIPPAFWVCFFRENSSVDMDTFIKKELRNSLHNNHMQHMASQAASKSNSSNTTLHSIDHILSRDESSRLSGIQQE